MTSPANRLITLIMLLQSKPNQKAGELAARLGISVRTLHRYFQELDEMGIPIFSERGPQGGFSLVRGYRMPPLVFTPEEAVALYLGTSLVSEMWGRLYREAAEGALAKLENVLPNDQREEADWARRTLVATRMHRADASLLSPILEKIRAGARQRRRIKIRYLGSTSEQESERMVDPYALAVRSGWWYLVGFCHLRQGMRTFRVDRIRELELSNQDFRPPEEFDAHAYLEAAFEEQPGIQARLCFVPEAAHIVMTNPMNWETMRQNPDGSMEVNATAPDLNWLASLVLGFGRWVRVLEPPELIELVRRWAVEVADQYPGRED